MIEILVSVTGLIHHIACSNNHIVFLNEGGGDQRFVAVVKAAMSSVDHVDLIFSE